MTLFEKYQQAQVLVAENRDSAAYYLTEKPSFNDIQYRLYEKIDDSRKCGDGVVGDRLLKGIDCTVIVHRKTQLTLGELLEQIAYHADFDTVYLFIRPLDIHIGDLYYSRLDYQVQVGVWEPNSNGSRTGRYFDQSIHNTEWRRKYKLPRLIPTLPEDELRRRYELVTPVKFSQNGDIWLPPKHEFYKISTTAYLWTDGKPEAAEVFRLDPVSKNLSDKDGNIFGIFAAEVMTLHTYAYHGFFKPSLDEVLVHIPADVVKSGLPILATTVAARNDSIYNMMVGDYHIGRTTFWYRVSTPVIDLTQISEEVLPVEVPPEETEECMICLTNTPNTLVLPCGHVCVCQDCSRKLPATADAKTCVRCRRPITEIIYG